jgi:hypothetical protein
LWTTGVTVIKQNMTNEISVLAILRNWQGFKGDDEPVVDPNRNAIG